MTIATKSHVVGKLPGRFSDLVALMPPHAIRDETDYDNMIEMLDRLTSVPRMTKGQELYLETMSILAEDYEAKHHAIDMSDIRGLDVLEFLMAENSMNASDLGRLLGNVSLGSKILRRERDLSKAHIRKLCAHFSVSSDLFLN